MGLSRLKSGLLMTCLGVLILIPGPLFGLEAGRGEVPYMPGLPNLPELDQSLGVESFEVGSWIPPTGLLATDMGRLSADVVDYDREKRVFTARGNARLEFRDKVIQSQVIIMDRQADTAVCSGMVRFDSERMALEAAQIQMNFKENWMNARGSVVYRRRERKPTREELLNPPRTRRGKLSAALKRRNSTITCTSFVHNWKTDDFTALGPVQVHADEYELLADKVEYKGDSGQGELDGPVTFKLLRGQWLIDEGVVEEDDKLARALIKYPTTISGDHMSYNEVKNTFSAQGGVTITQEGRSLAAAKLDVDEDKGTIVLDGNVQLYQKDGQWLFDGKVVTEDDDKVVQALAKPETTIKCARLEADYRRNTLLLQDSVSIEQSDKMLTADRLFVDDEKKWLEINGSVNLYQSSGQWLFDNKVITEDDDKVLRALARPETKLTCPRIAGYYEEDNKRFLLEDQVKVEQPDKSLEAAEMLALDTRDEEQLILSGQVTAHQSNGDWIFDNELVDKEEAGADAEEALRDEATVLSDYMQFDFDKKEHLALGNVRVQGKNHDLEAEAVYYRSDEKIIGIQGDVKTHKRDTEEWLYSDEIRYDQDLDLMEAWGSVETRIQIKPGEEEEQKK